MSKSVTPKISVLVICGPSGVGKGTLIERLQNVHPGKFSLVASHTTRAPRPGEEHGRDYHFVSDEDFEKEEYLERSEFAGNKYGTSLKALASSQEDGGCAVLDLNFEGVRSVKEKTTGAAYLLVLAPSNKELERRLRGRGAISEESFERRMLEALNLSGRAPLLSWDKILINDDLEATFQALEDFVVSS